MRNGANKAKSFSFSRKEHNQPLFEFKRVVFYSLLISLFLLAIGTAAADVSTITVKGDLQSGAQWDIYVYEGTGGGTNPCSGTGSKDANVNIGGDIIYDDNDDYTLSWAPTTTPIDVNVWFCDNAAKIANFTKASVAEGTTIYVDLGRITGDTYADDLDNDYVYVCNDFNGTRMNTEGTDFQVSAALNQFTQYYAFEDGIAANEKLYVFFDEDSTGPCIWDQTKVTGREIDTTNGGAYDNYGVAAIFSPQTKAQGYAHNDFDYGWMRVFNSYLGPDGNTDKVMVGMARFGDLGATEATRYTLYYDANGDAGAKLKVQLLKNPDPTATNVTPDMNILQVADGFTSLDANIKINGDMPAELDLVSSMIGTVDYQTTDIDSTPADYNLYVPVSTPTTKYWDAGAFKYSYLYGGAINSDQANLNISRVSGEAHSALETYPKTAIEMFTDNTCGTSVTQATGDPNYRVHPADTTGVDYNIYFTGNNGTYYSLVWYNDSTGDFNTCGNPVTTASQVGTLNLSQHLTGQVPTGAFTNVYIDYGQNGFTVGTDANTDDINAGGFYHVFGTSDIAVDVLFYNGATQELSKTKNFSSDVTLNVAKVSGDTHAQANDADIGQDLRVYSDSACAVTELSSRNGTPWSGNNPDYNQFYESSGAGTYYVKLDVNVAASDNVYTSCIKFAGTGNGATDTLNLARQLTGQIPTGVSTVAADLTEIGDYNARTSDFTGATPNITYYLYMPTDVDLTADVNFLNVSGTVLLSRNGVLNADETLDVSRIIGDAHANLQSAGALEICSSVACTTKYSSETVNPAANAGADDDFNVYYEVANAGSGDIFLHVTDSTIMDAHSYTDVDVFDGGNIVPGETDTLDLTRLFSGATVSEIAWIWVDTGGAEDGTWEIAADTNQTAYRFYHGYTGVTNRNVKADEDNLEANGVNLELTKDLSATILLNIDAIRGDVPTTFQNEVFQVESSSGQTCDGTGYGASGGTDTIPANVTLQGYDYTLYVEASGATYYVIACTGATKQLERSETASNSGNNYYDINIAKVSGEISADFDNSAGSTDSASVYSDSGCSTALNNITPNDIAIVVGGDDYNGFYEVSGAGTYYIKAVDSGISTYTSCIKFTSTGNGGTDALNVTRKIVSRTPAAVTKISISTTNDVNCTTSNAGDFNIYTTSGTATDRIYALNATPAVVLQRTIDLTADRTWNVAAVTGNAHAGLQETNVRDNVEVYNTGPAACGTLLSSEDVVIAATYTQYHESDGAGNVYINVTDSNTGYDYNTCIDTETSDTAGASASFALDKRLAGYVGSGITIVRIDRGQTTDEAYSTVVTSTTPDSYISYSPGNASTDVSFYNGATLELDRLAKNSTADLMINVGKLQGETHTNLETGTNDDVRVYSTITNNACVTELSSQAEAPVDALGAADYTQYFEAADGAYDNTFYFARYSATIGVPTYVTCDMNGFKTASLEYAGADAQRQVSGTVPDADSGDPDILYVMSDINASGQPNAATAPVDGGATTAYYLFLNSGAAGAGDDVNFYSDAAGTMPVLGKTTSLAGDTAINVSLVLGETEPAIEGGTDSIVVCASGLPNSYTDTTCDSYSSTITDYPKNNAGNDYNVFFEQSANTVYFMQIKDVNNFGGQTLGGGNSNFYSYHKFTSAAAGSRIEVSLISGLSGYLYEEYNKARPIADVNVNLLTQAGDWNVFTFTNVDGNYSAYSGGIYDLQYTKPGHITRNYTTNPGEMNDLTLSARLDTNLLNGVIVTVTDDTGNAITNATVQILAATNPPVVLSGCTNTATSICQRTGDNTSGNGSSGKYYFAGFSMPQTVWVKVYKAGWEIAVSPPADGSGQSVTATSNYVVTVYINDTGTPAPTLIGPANGSSTATLTPTLSWYDLGVDETDYNIQVDEDLAFGSPIVDTNANGANVTSYTTTTLVNGTTYYWRVAARDNEGLGNWSDERAFTVDTSAPTITSFSIDAGNAYTKSRAVTLNIVATGATYCNFSNSADVNWGDWEAYSDGNSYSWTLSPAEGIKTVYAQCKDDASNVVGPASDTITLDTNGPSALIVINDGNQFTVATAVTADVNASDASGVTCTYSLDNVTWTGISCPGTDQAITLPTGDGLKQVFLKATDGAGNVTNESATIVLDQTAPTTQTLTATTSSNQARLTWTAGTDPTSGIDHYNVYAAYEADPAATSAYRIVSGLSSQEYTYSPQWNGTWRFGVTGVDKLGNESAISNIAYAAVDLNAPTEASIIINDGSTYTATTSVTIDTNAQNAVLCQFKTEDDTVWTDITCAAATAVALSGVEGVRTVYFRAIDGNQNATEASDTIIYDASVPETAPSALTATVSSNQVLLTWTAGADAVSGIKHYKIYRNTTTGLGTYINATTGTAYTDSPGMTGTYYYIVRAVNNADLEETNTTEVNRSVDFNGPVALAVSINDGNMYAKSLGVSIDVSVWGANTCEYTYDTGATWNAAVCNGTTVVALPSGDGDKNVCVRAIDTNNNYISACDTIYIDTTAPGTPTAKFPVAAITTIGRDFQWQWNASSGTGSPIDYYLVTLTSTATIDTYTTQELYTKDYSRDLNNGKVYVLAVVAFDQAGNNSGTLTFSNVTVDLNSPITAVNAPTGDTNSVIPTISIAVSNAVQTCEFLLSVDGGVGGFVNSEPITASGNACTWTVPVWNALSHGETFSIAATVTDQAGQDRTLTFTRNYLIDTVAPSVTIYTPADHTILSDTTPEVYFIADDNSVGQSGMDWSRFIVDINGVTTAVEFDCSVTDSNIAFYCYFDVPAGSAFTDGVAGNYISVTVADMAGNYSTTDTVTDLNVDATDYITLNSITASNINGQADDTNSHAWKWDFNTTFGVGSIGDDKNKLRFKLANWTSATTSTTLYVDGNAEMVYDANIAGIQTTKVYNIKTTYDTTQTVYQFWDHNPLTTAIDANFYIQQRIPSSIAAGSYSTTYGIKSYAS
jgi:hypothetical protein